MEKKLGKLSMLALMALVAVTNTISATNANASSTNGSNLSYIEHLGEMLRNTAVLPTETDTIKSRVTVGNKFATSNITFSPVVNINSQYYISNMDTFGDYPISSSAGINLRFDAKSSESSSSSRVVSLLANYNSSYPVHNNVTLGMMTNVGIGNATSKFEPDLGVGINGYVGYVDEMYSLSANIGSGIQYIFRPVKTSNNHEVAVIVFGNAAYTLPLDVEQGINFAVSALTSVYESAASSAYYHPVAINSSIGYQLDENWAVSVDYTATTESLTGQQSATWNHIVSLSLHMDMDR